MEKVTRKQVLEEMCLFRDRKYAAFQGSLLPGVDSIMGVRLPRLRAIAKGLAKKDWEEWFFAAEDEWYEETMLRGLTVAYAKLECRERLDYLRRFVPDIDNWAVCDCVAGTIKEARGYPEVYLEFLRPYLASEREFEARFGAVMLLSHFVKKEYLEQAVSCLESVRQKDYYARMAVAWAISEYFAAFPKEMLAYLQGGHHLDEFTYKKALQKILESFRVDQETKRIIREMRQRGQ